MPASNLFGTYVGELFAGDSLQQHPHLTAFWIPRPGRERHLLEGC